MFGKCKTAFDKVRMWKLIMLLLRNKIAGQWNQVPPVLISDA